MTVPKGMTPYEFQAELLTTNEVAAALKTTRKKVGYFRKYGLLPTRKIGRGHCVTRKELADFVELTRDADLSSEADIITFSNYLQKAGKLKKGLTAKSS